VWEGKRNQRRISQKYYSPLLDKEEGEGGSGMSFPALPSSVYGAIQFSQNRR